MRVNAFVVQGRDRGVGTWHVYGTYNDTQEELARGRLERLRDSVEATGDNREFRVVAEIRKLEELDW